VNLPCRGWLTARRPRPDVRRAFESALLSASRWLRPPAGPRRAVDRSGIAAPAAVLELINPRNYWLLFEDVSCGVAPVAATIAVALAAERGGPELAHFRRVFAVALGFHCNGPAHRRRP